MSTVPNNNNNKTTNGENNKTAHPPKKRSLSSYLSKISARKEELEKLKHTDDKIEELPAQEVALSTKQDIKLDTKLEDKPEPVNSTETTSVPTTSITIEHKPVSVSVSPTVIEFQHIKASATSESKPTELSNMTESKPIEPSNSTETEPFEPLSEKIESNEVLKTNIMELVNETRKKLDQVNELTTQAVPVVPVVPVNSNNDHQQTQLELQKLEQQQQVELESMDSSHLTTFSRDELKSVLKDPSFLPSSPQKTTPDKFELSKQEDQKKKPYEMEVKQQVANANDMIDSDTETPRGSPIKIKKGRLIRGDKLQHLSSVLNSATYNNDSDSELSDVNDNKEVNITSSFLTESSTKNNTQKNKENKSTSPLKKTIKRNPTSSHIAVSKGVKNKKSVYRDAGGRTRLQIACDKGKIDVVKKLLDDAINNPNSNVDINDQDNAGNTPLHEAALNGHIDIVELLLDHGANVNIQSFEYFQDTPLIDASANGHLDVVEFLLTKGADPTITNARGLTAYEAIDEEDSELDEEEKDLVREIKKTLRKGTQVWTNTHHDDIKTHETHESRVLKRQTSNTDQDSKNANNNANNNHSDDNMESNNVIEFYWTDLTSKAGKDKLMQAAKQGYLAYVGQYLENGGRIDFKSFLESVRFGHEDIASLFLAFGAQVNKLNREDYTPLMVAVGRGHFGTVKLLLEAGADPTIKNKKGHTALYYARNSPVGVIDDDEIELLIKSVKSHGGSIEQEEKEEEEEEEEVQKPVEEEKVEKVKPSKECVTIKSSKSTESISNISKENKDLKRTGSTEKITATPVSAQEKSELEPVEKTALDSIFDEDSSNNNSNINLKQETSNIVQSEPEKNGKNKRVREESKEEEEEEEEPVVPTSKYSHNSPSLANIPRKRSISAITDESSQTNEPDASPSTTPPYPPLPLPSSTVQHEDKKSKFEHVETEKERQERLKSEEEYLQRKLQNKRRKELELIQKLQEDEKKRVEEKEKAKLEEAKKLEQLFKAKELELERKEKEIEIEKRRRIRLMYPLGLKLIKFNGKPDMSLLPLYYVIKDGGRYVFDLQLLMILKNPEMITSQERIAIVEQDEKLQLWNIHRQAFLFGGSNYNDDDNTNQYAKIFNEISSLTQRLQFENEEYQKFLKLPMNWISWEAILPEVVNLGVEAQLESNMVELSALSHDKNATIARTGTKNRDSHATRHNVPLTLPIRLQHRPQVVRLLKHELFTESQPLW